MPPLCTPSRTVLDVFSHVNPHLSPGVGSFVGPFAGLDAAPDTERSPDVCQIFTKIEDQVSACCDVELLGLDSTELPSLLDDAVPGLCDAELADLDDAELPSLDDAVLPALVSAAQLPSMRPSLGLPPLTEKWLTVAFPLRSGRVAA